MSILPPKYAWLAGVHAPPRLLTEAIKLLGVTERPARPAPVKIVPTPPGPYKTAGDEL